MIQKRRARPTDLKNSAKAGTKTEGCYVAPGDGGDVGAARAAAVAQRWGLPLAQPDQEAGPRLWVDEQGVRLGDSRPGAPGPVRVDFLDLALLRRLRQAGPAREGLARAVGARKGERPRVVDATAGLGQDAAVLAALGCPLVLVERSAVMAALLEDGLRRAATDGRTKEMAGRMRLVHAESVTYLSGLGEEERPEVVYLDPMYSARRGGALSGRSMQHLQNLLGHDEEPSRLLQAALAVARRRVVVKRRRTAASLTGPSPDVSIQGQSTRFDVYLRQG